MGGIIASKRFEVIATGGAGPGGAIAARSMTFFRGALYLGSSCENAGSYDPPRILRYAERTGEWETAYQSPLAEPGIRSQVPDRQIVGHLGGRNSASFGPRRTEGKVPRDVGYRSMCVFRGASDPEPALYVSSMSRGGGVLLRSRDGRTFEEIGQPGPGNRDIYSFDGLTALGGLLFAAPAGTVTDTYLDSNEPPEAKLYVCEDPDAGTWREASEIAFGDRRNIGISALATAHGHLYAGTANLERGFQLWRTDAKGQPPYTWEPIVRDGAGAFNQNFTVTAMAEFNGALYVGSGITGLGYDVVRDIGPASAELVRVHPDGTWDLIAGRMRFTEDGLKVPLSLLGPGLGDFYNSMPLSLSTHDGALYLGTCHWEAFRALELDAEQLVGGYQLWASENGEEWEMVIDDGHGNPAQLEICALASTPLGLFVGTGNRSQLLKLLGRRHNRSDLQFEDGFEILLGK